MKKIKLTPPEEQACRDVIAFWLTVERRLKAGEKIIGACWENNSEPVISYDGGEGCPFCIVAWDMRGLNSGSECFFCAYYKFYGFKCHNIPGHLAMFRKDPNPTTCRSAIESVERILANSEGR